MIAEKEKPKSNEVQIILYKKGKQKIFDNQSPYFHELLQECERLLETADDVYLLIVTDDLVNGIKKRQIGLEIIYPQVVFLTVLGRKTEIERFFIPLKGRWSRGTIFYGVPYSDKDLGLEGIYSGNAFNTQGVDKLKEILKKMSAKID